MIVKDKKTSSVEKALENVMNTEKKLRLEINNLYKVILQDYYDDNSFNEIELQRYEQLMDEINKKVEKANTNIKQKCLITIPFT